MLFWYLVCIKMVLARYGMYGLVTGQRSRHAAMGRAKRTWALANHRDTLYRACDLVEKLKSERMRKVVIIPA